MSRDARIRVAGPSDPRRRRLFAALTGATLAACAPGLRAETVLRVLAWPGYADPDLIASFEARHRVRVELSLVDSDDMLWKQLGEGAFDVLAANTAEIARMIERGLIAPIEDAALGNLGRQLPRFRLAERLPAIFWGGRRHAVPYAHADMGLIYDRSRIPEPPTSILAMWDPRLRGKVLAYDGSSHNFSLAALSLGLPPFAIGQADWPRVVERLIALRRNVRAFYSLPEESLALFRDGGAWLLVANYGKQQLTELRRAGLDVGYAIPHEGALAWLDCWAISSTAREPALALAWIDHLLQPEAALALTQRHGLGNTLYVTGEDEAARLYWLEQVEDAALRHSLWRQIIAGDRPERFQFDAPVFGSRP